MNYCIQDFIVILIHMSSYYRLELYHSPGWCNFVSFADRLSKFLVLWFVVAFATDRYIWFCHPKTNHAMCTPFRAKIVVICLSLLGLVVFMNISLTVGVVKQVNKSPSCEVLIIFRRHLDVLDFIDVVVNVLLPYIVLAVLLALIASAASQSRCLPRYGCHTTEEPSDEAAWKWEKKIFCLRWKMWCRGPLARPATKQQYTNVNTNSAACDAPSRTSSTIHRPDGAELDRPVERESHLLTVMFLILFFVTSLPLELWSVVRMARDLMGWKSSNIVVEKSAQFICQQVFVTSLCLQFWVSFAFYAEVRRVWKDIMCKCNPRGSPEVEMIAQDDPSAAVSELGAPGNSQSYV